MKKLLALSLFILWLALAAFGEVLIVQRVHVNSFYHEGVQRPERTNIVNIWIAPRRMAYQTGSVRIIVDADRDLVAIVNEAAKTYAQAALSRPIAASMTPDDREATPPHTIRASVREAGGSRTVLGRSCREYTLELRSNLDHKVTAWASSDVPLDPAAYGKLMEMMHDFLGRYDARSIDALLSMKGYILSQENVADLKGEIIRVNRDVTEIGEKTPPSGVFVVPAGFVKKPGLTHEDADIIASILE